MSVLYERCNYYYFLQYLVFFPLLERIFEELVIIQAEDGRCYFCNLLKTQICIWGFALYKNMQLYLIKLVSGARLDFRIIDFQRCGM